MYLYCAAPRGCGVTSAKSAIPPVVQVKRGHAALRQRGLPQSGADHTARAAAPGTTGTEAAEPSHCALRDSSAQTMVDLVGAKVVETLGHLRGVHFWLLVGRGAFGRPNTQKSW